MLPKQPRAWSPSPPRAPCRARSMRRPPAGAAERTARGHEVLLTTTAPAGHLTETPAGDMPHLAVGRIDPAIETQNGRAPVGTDRLRAPVGHTPLAA